MNQLASYLSGPKIIRDQGPKRGKGRRKPRSSALRQITDIAVLRRVQRSGTVDPIAFFRCTSCVRNAAPVSAPGPAGRPVQNGGFRDWHRSTPLAPLTIIFQSGGGTEPGLGKKDPEEA